MNLIAAEIQTEHIALILAVASTICSVGIGIMQMMMRSKSSKDGAHFQSPACHYQHESLGAATARIEASHKDIIATQRDICESLERVGSTLERVVEKLDSGGK